MHGPHPAAKRIDTIISFVVEKSFLLMDRFLEWSIPFLHVYVNGNRILQRRTFYEKVHGLFQDSMEELKHVNTVTVMAMFAAISVVLGYFTLVLGDYLKIGFSTIANQFVYYLFGPVVGAACLAVPLIS